MDRMTVPTPSPLLSGALVRVSFAGANPVRPQGRGETPTRSHFFLGDDPAMWRTNIRSYREVVYKDLYDGIDLVYRLLPDGLKSDFLVRPGADPARITMAYEGVDSLEVNHASVPEVRPNDDFGLKVREHAREHDVVYRVT